MDWSLALASQGIEVILDRGPGSSGWVLWLEPEDHGRALGVIRQYCRENRGWPWQRELFWPGALFHWGALLWCWLLVVVHWLAEAGSGRVEALGTMASAAFAGGEWWRLITAVGLHADVAHLAANAATGMVVFGLAMARFGAGWAMLAGLVAGAVGNWARWGVHSGPYVGLGASGMVMGGLGLLAAQMVFLLWEERRAFRQVASGVLGGVLLFVLVGLNPASDVVAHTAGFGVGLVEGVLLGRLQAGGRLGGRWDRIAGVTAIGLYAGAWVLAVAVGGAR